MHHVSRLTCTERRPRDPEGQLDNMTTSQRMVLYPCFSVLRVDPRDKVGTHEIPPVLLHGKTSGRPKDLSVIDQNDKCTRTQEPRLTQILGHEREEQLALFGFWNVLNKY